MIRESLCKNEFPQQKEGANEIPDYFQNHTFKNCGKIVRWQKIREI